MEPMHQQSKIMEKFCSRQILQSYSSLIFSALMLMRTDSSTMLSPSSLVGTVKPFLVIFIKRKSRNFSCLRQCKEQTTEARQSIQKNPESSKTTFHEPETTQPSPHLGGDSTGDLLKDFSSTYTQIIQKGFVFIFNSSNGGSVPPAPREINRQKRWHIQSQRPHTGLRKHRGSQWPSEPSVQDTGFSNRFWSWISAAEIQQKTPGLPNYPPQTLKNKFQGPALRNWKAEVPLWGTHVRILNFTGLHRFKTQEWIIQKSLTIFI